MNQLEQRFSILQREHLTARNFADLEALEERVLCHLPAALAAVSVLYSRCCS